MCSLSIGTRRVIKTDINNDLSILNDMRETQVQFMTKVKVKSGVVLNVLYQYSSVENLIFKLDGTFYVSFMHHEY